MFKWVTEPEDMNTPSNNIIVFNRIHIFPSELQMLSKSKTMNMYLCTSSEDIGLCAELSSSSWSEYFDSYRIDIIYFIVCKVYNNFLEAIVLSTSECNWFVVWMISDVSYVSSSEFEKFGRRSFVAFKEISSLLRILGKIKDCAKNLSIGILTFNRVKRLLKNNFLGLLMFLMQEDLSELGSLSHKITHFLQHFGIFQLQSEWDRQQEGDDQYFGH